MRMLRYHVFGLHFESEIAFPELESSESAPDVSIRFGDVDFESPPSSSRSFCRTDGDTCLLHLKAVGDFSIRAGREIRMAPAPDTADDLLRSTLLGVCLSVILHQRGILALHASSIRTPHGAILFTGSVGSGKSTILGAFLERGYRMLADDVTAVAVGSDGLPLVLPGYPQTKLWIDSAGELGHDTDNLVRIDPQRDKFAVPMRDLFSGEPAPLLAVYLLSPWDRETFEIDAMTDSRKFDVLSDNTYRKSLLDCLGLRANHFTLAVAVARATPIRRVRRPMSGFRLRELADAIEADLGDLRPRDC